MQIVVSSIVTSSDYENIPSLNQSLLLLDEVLMTEKPFNRSQCQFKVCSEVVEREQAFRIIRAVCSLFETLVNLPVCLCIGTRLCGQMDVTSQSFYLALRIHSLGALRVGRRDEPRADHSQLTFSNLANRSSKSDSLDVI